MNSNQDKALVKNNEEDDVIFNEDEKTIPEPIFELKRFIINKDVYFDIEIAYIEGHPIVKTKTLKLYYHSDKPEDMSSQGKLASSLIAHGRKTKFAINLLNYLCRFINGFNLFHCYVYDEIKTYKEELKDFITHENQDRLEDEKTGIFTNVGADERSQKGKNSFLNELIKHREINEDLVNHYRDPRLPEKIPNLKGLHYIPIWTYVHPSLAKNQGSTIHICHFAFLLERLAHNDNYPEFNNAAALALLNITNESDTSGLDVKTINENKYNHMVERKTFYKNAYREEKIAHAETQEKLDIVIDQNKTLIKTIADQNSIIQDQSNQIEELKNMNLNQMENLDSLIDLNVNMNGRLISMDHRMKHKDETLDRLSKKVGWVVHDIGQMSMRQVVTDATEDILVLYTSQLKPIDKGRMPIAEHDQIWIASYNGDINNFKVPKVPEDANEIYRVPANRLNSFKKMIEDQNVKPFIISVYDRSILIHENSIDDFIQAVDRALNEQGQFQSIIKLREIHDEIKQRKEERKIKKENEDYLEFKREVYRSNAKPKIIISSRRRVLYLKRLNDQGNETYVPLNECDIEEVAKGSWWYRWGSGGCHIDELDKTTILTSRYTSDPEPRIKYE